MSVLAFNQFSTNILTACLRTRSFYHPEEVVQGLALDTVLLAPEHPYPMVDDPISSLEYTLTSIDRSPVLPPLWKTFQASFMQLRETNPELADVIQPVTGLLNRKVSVGEVRQALRQSVGRLREQIPAEATEIAHQIDMSDRHLNLMQLSFGQYTGLDPFDLREPAEELFLVVEDDRMISRIIKRFLSIQGYGVVVQSFPLEALAFMQSEEGAEVTAIITDNDMVGMGGREMVLEIRRQHPGMPVMMQSGGFEGGQPIDPLTAFLPKPYGYDELLASITVWLSGAQRAGLQN